MEDQFQTYLGWYLPEARLEYSKLPECGGLELLLIEAGFDDSQLSFDQIERLSDDPPYWIFCWASGRAMAQLILSGGIDVKGKVVADFGAGSGVVAIAAKLAGASQVYACDIDERCRELTTLNAKRNGVELHVIDDLSSISEPIDLILAADVLYEKKNLAFLDLMLNACESVVIADSRLKHMPDHRFRHFQTLTTTSFPDFQEAKANNEVKFYRSEG
ncbi:class I SAM-dependent methyltransferase [Ketobacter alkanivorans]|uniref:Protein methyltransferase n=1 Tax=Ketobacter alkanivorans TaxID=1917421 RepID=A0A2K9LF98_9GAMM|nr:50S ribosomal protein L11 methyltransferase [Ketobacter alkanivorans]AUM10952.1 hypothetical protein Kalk_00190 [Ketobacter alkanivorans]MCP5016491.1 methyltransferase [Ketobacter sp.]